MRMRWAIAGIIAVVYATALVFLQTLSEIAHASDPLLVIMSVAGMLGIVFSIASMPAYSVVDCLRQMALLSGAILAPGLLYFSASRLLLSWHDKPLGLLPGVAPYVIFLPVIGSGVTYLLSLGIQRLTARYHWRSRHLLF